MLVSALEKCSLAKVIPASRSVLGPFASIVSIALVNVLASVVSSETKEASSIVPSKETSVFVEKLTAPTFTFSFPSNILFAKL